jgi:sigma-54 dependent transcriptional regulator, acetoin dehydrogenase operon transcriptional activator AcoR
LSVDLFYRIAKIKIPPLRERTEDIPALVQHFLVELHPKKSIIVTNDALDLMRAYHWPGNIRQLKSVVESICMRLTDCVIREKDICQALPQIADLFGNRVTKVLVGRYGTSLITRERDRFERAIIETNGDRDKAAVSLGLSRATFYRRAKELGLVKTRRSRLQLN